MKITQALLDELTAKAKESPRLRMNLDLRDSAKNGGTGTEVNPESWTQLKGSNEKGI